MEAEQPLCRGTPTAEGLFFCYERSFTVSTTAVRSSVAP